MYIHIRWTSTYTYTYIERRRTGTCGGDKYRGGKTERRPLYLRWSRWILAESSFRIFTPISSPPPHRPLRLPLFSPLAFAALSSRIESLRLGSCSLPPFSSSSLLPFLPDHPSESPEAKNLPVFHEGVGTSRSVTPLLDEGRQLSFTKREKEKERAWP